MRFVVIEDHALIFESLRIHICETFPDSEIEHLTEVDLGEIKKLSPLDCVVFDPNLGMGSRYDLIGDIKIELPDVPIIVLSADLDISAPKKALAFGASAFIRKGKGAQPLGQIFDLVINGGQNIFSGLENSPDQESSDILAIEDVLTPREREILSYLLETGASNKSMARNFRISESAIKYHLGNILRKFGVKNRTELVLLFKG